MTSAFILSLAGVIAYGAADTYNLGSVSISVGDPVLVYKSDAHRVWFPSVLQLDDKTLVANIGRAADEINPDAAESLRAISKDAGRTWTAPEPWAESGNSWARLNDGTCLWLSYLLTYRSETEAACRVGRSKDGLEYVWADAPVNLAPLKFDKAEKGTASLVFHQSIVEADDGSLLATMYGHCTGDTSYRSVLVKSTDGGLSWHLLSTIAHDSSIEGEGPCEPSLVRLANGDLFCMMRVSSSRPMCFTRSTDGGLTWAPLTRMPETHASVSVDPDLVLLSDGVLVCAAGRPDCWIMLSLDGQGREWSAPVKVYEGPTTAYSCIRETAPGELVYIHDVTPAGWETPAAGVFHEIRCVPIKIARH
ncbi:MAG: exo-alpha-sialidase [Candidatus Hydrogenedentes bacterium]|nr:exo-alpha-sialidase [Candidatus Hydrogenedentota bacterium]